ncbi:hypothetical protein CGRA01v4_04851 [Colletotrichum graminicola]|nr:hypothetical protein CGRA01v4_04851 [Colletotrichum graminicola]
MQTMDRAALLQVGIHKRDGVWDHGIGDDLMIEQPELLPTSTRHERFGQNTKPPVAGHSPSRFGTFNGLENHLRKHNAMPVTLASSVYFSFSTRQRSNKTAHEAAQGSCFPGSLKRVYIGNKNRRGRLACDCG